MASCVGQFEQTTKGSIDGVLRPMPKVLGSLLDDVQPGAVLGLPLFDRENSSAKVSEFYQFQLDFL